MKRRLLNLYDYEREAQECMDRRAFDYYAGGSMDERTLRANCAAFDPLEFLPRMPLVQEDVSMTTSVLGHRISLPVFLAPTAYMRLAHPDGEVAAVQAAADAGTLAVVSINASVTLEEIAQAARGPLWQQLYLYPDQGYMRELIARIEAAQQYRALVLTVDRPVYGKRERDLYNGFTLPPSVRPANFATSQISPRTDQALVTWQDVEHLRSQTLLPIVLKGILTAEDAVQAVEHGVEAIIVSNHGGRQLDGAIATIKALPQVVEAVAGRCEVYVDGGIRRGTDILKALALGARAVLVGRPILWGLAVNGREGVLHVLQLLREELEQAMLLSGRPTLESIDGSLLAQP